MSDYDEAAAESYQRMVEPLTGSFAAALLDAAGGGTLAGMNVLDCACGTGAVTLCAEALGAVHVPGALSIDPPAYCRGLWSLCRSLGSASTEASFMLVSNKSLLVSNKSHTHV